MLEEQYSQRSGLVGVTAKSLTITVSGSSISGNNTSQVVTQVNTDGDDVNDPFFIIPYVNLYGNGGAKVLLTHSFDPIKFRWGTGDFLFTAQLDGT